MQTKTKNMLSFLEDIKIKATDPEIRHIITGVDWEEYLLLLDRITNSAKYRVSYLDEILEIMTTSRTHEIIKENIGNLLQAYLEEAEIDFWALGSTTFRKEDGLAGKEPDKSYCIGSEKELPDLAIEVAITSGGIDTLEIYRRLGVKEVWIWKDNKLNIYCLSNNNYRQEEKSILFPKLDIKLLEKLAVAESPRKAIKELRQTVRRV